MCSFSFVCAISNPETVVITGGGDNQNPNIVSVYNDQGWQEDLAPLINARQRHGCAGYTSGGKRVSQIISCENENLFSIEFN